MSQERKFKTGDLVRLRSGGPVMTIGHVSGVPPFSKCYYFRERELIETLDLNHLMLESAEGKSKESETA